MSKIGEKRKLAVGSETLPSREWKVGDLERCKERGEHFMELGTFIEATKEGHICYLTFNFDGAHVKLLQSKVLWIGAKTTSDHRGGAKAARKASEPAKIAEKLDDDDDSD